MDYVPELFLTYEFVITAIILFLCSLCIRPAYSHWKHVQILQKIPGPYLHPLWGTMDRFPPTNEGMQNTDKHLLEHPGDKALLFRIGPHLNFVVFCYPEEISELLNMKPGSLPKDDFIYGFMKPLLGEGLLISNFDKWQSRRRLLTPGFHYGILKPYVRIYNDKVETFIRKCEGKLASGEDVISVFANVTLLTLDVMLQCACSYDSDCQLERGEDEYVKALKSNIDLVYKQLTYLAYAFRPIFHISREGAIWRKNCKVVKDQSMKVVLSRRAFLMANPDLYENKPIKDFIDILLTEKDADGNGLTNEGIVEELTTFLFRGHDTTASAISWTLHLLGMHPKYQNMCREELREVLENRESDSIQWDDLPKLNFLAMCIKESMRLFMPVNDIYRMPNEDLHLGGYLIPKGTHLVMSIGALHRNPHIWENPSEFNPMRFDCELPGGHPFAYIPFSGGHRNCIGQKFAFNELLVSVGRIINKFEIESLTKEPRRLAVVILKPEVDLKIRLKLAK